ncbi:MAG: rhodanese-like domain-containing protein [Candidatus Pacearchaeota archaeon]
MDTISAEELKSKIDDGEDFVLVDVLGQDSYTAKHLPDAINIPVNEIEDKASEKLPDKDKEVIVYCASTDCQASPQAAEKLEELGYKNVKDFESGIAGWQEAGYELEGEAA